MSCGFFFTTGFDVAPFSEDKVTELMESTKAMYQKMIKDGKMPGFALKRKGMDEQEVY